MAENIKNELKAMNVFTEFFSNIVTNLELRQQSNYEPEIDIIEDPS